MLLYGSKSNLFVARNRGSMESIMKSKFLFFCAVVAVVILSMPGCNEDIGVIPREEEHAETFTDLETRIKRNNEFAIALYHKICEEKENFLISPHSTSVAFAMLYAGARGATEREIANVMCFHQPQGNGFHLAMS